MWMCSCGCGCGCVYALGSSGDLTRGQLARIAVARNAVQLRLLELESKVRSSELDLRYKALLVDGVRSALVISECQW